MLTACVSQYQDTFSSPAGVGKNNVNTGSIHLKGQRQAWVIPANSRVKQQATVKHTVTAAFTSSDICSKRMPKSRNTSLSSEWIWWISSASELIACCALTSRSQVTFELPSNNSELCSVECSAQSAAAAAAACFRAPITWWSQVLRENKESSNQPLGRFGWTLSLKSPRGNQMLCSEQRYKHKKDQPVSFQKKASQQTANDPAQWLWLTCWTEDPSRVRFACDLVVGIVVINEITQQQQTQEKASR